LHRRNTFLLGMEDRQPQAPHRDFIHPNMIKLEAALLVALTSIDASVCSSAVACFGLLCDEHDILGEHNLAVTTVGTNHEIYRTLSTTSGHIGGRVMQQKQFHNIFSRLDVLTAGNLAGWEEILDRFNDLTAKLRDSDGGEQAKFVRCAFCG
jgi:hypothetical protein